MQEYYAHLYPYDRLVELLTCNGDKLADVEFALEGKSESGAKIYKRFVSVATAAALRAAVSKFPGISAVHFGAFYSNCPTMRASGSVPVRRVLSFDIDLTDKEFLTLKDADGNVSPEMCDAACPVSAMSAYILRRMLQKAFGYSRILIVYSGRRGVHVHVFDERAMQLNDEARSAVVSYVNGSMHESGLHATSGVRLVMEMHGLRREVYRAFKTYIVGEMQVFANCSARVRFVQQLNLARYEAQDHQVLAPQIAALTDDVLDAETSEAAWAFLEKRVDDFGQDWVRARLDLVVLSYVWPRLDENVTRSLGHLTKVPFSCHATSGRIAVAMGIDRASIYNFNPARQAPSLKCWDQALMDDAVERFRVQPGAAPTPADVDMEDAVQPLRALVPRGRSVARKPSPLGPHAR